MIPTAPTGLRFDSSEARFLIGLSRDQERVVVVGRGMPADELDGLGEFGILARRERVPNPIGVGEIALEQNVPEHRALARLVHEAVDRGQQLRGALADRPGDLATLVHGEVGSERDVLEDLRPELGLMAVDDHRRDHADFDELDQVVVLEVLIRLDDRNQRLSFSLTPGV